MVLTSLPFSTQYEYTPSYHDFGHTEDNEHFFAQMDYLTPELLRVLKPGRVAAIHCKDRIMPGGMTGLGFQTVYPFHSDVIRHFTSHGFVNGAQHAKGREMHLCPLQFDIVERLITQFTMEGEEVYDPFGGLMTVPYCAVKLRRRGRGCELETRYFLDGAEYCKAAEAELATPTLFDLTDPEENILPLINADDADRIGPLHGADA
jgi:hypothetical protein